MWTLIEALNLIRKLEEPLLKIGYAVGLTGSVLFRDQSDNDLDLIIYPMDSTNVVNYLELKKVLNYFEMFRMHSARKTKESWKAKGSNDEKNVEIWWCRDTKKRVDIFLLS